MRRAGMVVRDHERRGWNGCAATSAVTPSFENGYHDRSVQKCAMRGKTPHRNGATHVIFKPIAARHAGLLPKLRMNLIRFVACVS